MNITKKLKTVAYILATSLTTFGRIILILMAICSLVLGVIILEDKTYLDSFYRCLVFVGSCWMASSLLIKAGLDDDHTEVTPFKNGVHAKD